MQMLYDFVTNQTIDFSMVSIEPRPFDTDTFFNLLGWTFPNSKGIKCNVTQNPCYYRSKTIPKRTENFPSDFFLTCDEDIFLKSASNLLKWLPQSNYSCRSNGSSKMPVLLQQKPTEIVAH